MIAYASLQQARALLNTPSSDTADDAVITDCITRATALIDRYMKTIRSTFVSFEAQTLTKYIDTDGYRYIEVPDLLTITSLASDTSLNGLYSTTIASTDYWLPDVAPYNWIELTGRGTTAYWTAGTRTVKIVGTWGYAATCPADVTQATLEEAIRMFKARDAGFSDVIGVAGDGGMVFSRALGARTKMILQSYARPIFA